MPLKKILIDALLGQLVVTGNRRRERIRRQAHLLGQLFNGIGLKDQPILNHAFEHRDDAVALSDVDGNLRAAILVVGQNVIRHIARQNRGIYTVRLEGSRIVHEVIWHRFVGEALALFVDLQIRLRADNQLAHRARENKIAVRILHITGLHARRDDTAVKDHRRTAAVHLRARPNARTNAAAGVRGVIAVGGDALGNNRRERLTESWVERQPHAIFHESKGSRQVFSLPAPFSLFMKLISPGPARC